MIIPAEWAPQARIFTAFPSHADLWEEDLAPAQAEVAALVRQLAATVPVTLLVHGTDAESAAHDLPATIAQIAFGDIWLRDTGPIFASPSVAARFRFNGWGGKYVLSDDDGVGDRIAALQSATVTPYPFVLEGGAIDHDGQGLVLTTEQCLLHRNRNGWTRADAETALRHSVGTRRVIWLGDGLVNDHTDGHVDNLARFVGGGTVAIPEADRADDPNAAVFADAAARARAANLVVVPMPSVGPYHDTEGAVVPASYMNWIIANGRVIMPTYGAPNDAAALAQLSRLFPRHRVHGLAARHILTGGGSFHCITQQVPQ